LEYCQYLWYRISIHGFSTKNTNHDIRSTEIKDSDIIFTNLEKLFKANINPKYIKIPRFLYKILYSWEHQWKFALAHTENILQEIRDRNCEVLISDWQGEYSDVSISSIETPEILKNSSIRQNELCLDMNWNIQFTEALINFWEWISTPNWLQFLKERWITEALMNKVFHEATFPRVLNWESISSNLYLKDIESDAFMEIILNLAHWLPSYVMRKKVILEIVEESYGTLNNTVISNLKKAKDLWFSIAIDDFCVSDSQIWISREILVALYENGINIDYLKIDWWHIMDIYNDTISPIDLAKLRQVIKLFKEKWVVFIAEFVQNKEHADLITRKIGCPWAKILFQWRYLNEWWK
jgi:EAL domain-containing protein (putative c-di-GMP-specific phosphodiesterase class I)